MVDQTTRSLGKYVGYFRDRIDEISKLGGVLDGPGYFSRLEFQRILYMTVLDALSKAVFPAESSNRRRMVDFFVQFSRWGPDARRVSLPHLRRLLEKAEDLVPDEALRQFVSKKMDQWPCIGYIPLARDPDIDEVVGLWPDTDPMGLKLHRFRHCDLLYESRNYLVHEHRQQGRSIELGDHVTPSYQHQSILDETGKVCEHAFELVYPPGFLRTLCEGGLESVEDYFLCNALDPVDSYNLGSFYIRQLL